MALGGGGGGTVVSKDLKKKKKDRVVIGAGAPLAPGPVQPGDLHPVQDLPQPPAGDQAPNLRSQELPGRRRRRRRRQGSLPPMFL